MSSLRAAALTAAATMLLAPAALAITLPASFVVDDMVPGVMFDTPTTVAFRPDGSMLVGEKRGQVWVVQNGIRSTTPLLARDNEILNQGDRGLLAVAVDPNYATNRYIYLLYTVDPDSNGTDDNNDAFGRLTRYQVSAGDPNAVVASSRTILMGYNWRNGPLIASPSHTVGDLNWGSDGSLLVSVGDGGQFNQMDPGGLDAAAFGSGGNKTDPYEDIGAFRAQYLGSLCGKILRIDPATGRGYPSNPYYDGNPASVRSRVWAYGVRNSYRFTRRPGTGALDPAAGSPGTLYMGDVGWGTWEDLNVCSAPGQNFGWPCYEGMGQQSSYQGASPSHHGCGTMGTTDNPAPHTPPILTSHHSQTGMSVPPGFKGNAVTAGVFYIATQYPAQYRQQFFFGDYGQSWIKVAVVDASNQLVQLLDFAEAADGPVDFAIEPASGNLVYVAIAAGQVRRLRYTGATGNSAPVASASGTPTIGAAPLAVSFSSAGSIDPDNDPLTFSWNFGDGEGSTLPDPQHTYDAAGTYNAVLTVDDGHGGVGRDTVMVFASGTSGFPSTGVLDNFNRSNGPIGGSWVGETAGLVINASALTQTGGNATTVWNGAVFGPDQEAHIRFLAMTPGAPEHDLMLKVQGVSAFDGHIEVRYDDGYQQVAVATYVSRSGWTTRATFPVTFGIGDQLGARAYGDGTIEVYKNGVPIGATSAGDWPFAAQGGRLGMTIAGATASRMDDFGGGNVVFQNTAPTALIRSPADGSFFAAGDTIRLIGTGSDAQQDSSALSYGWNVIVHHNNHQHPSSFVASGPVAAFAAEDHDDGTGVHYEIELRVTDAGNLGDTTSVHVWPQIDLTPSAVKTVPSTPGTTTPAQYSFRIRNLGRMKAPISRWRLRAGNALLAEGDTLVPALDSVTVNLMLPPTLAAGAHTLRVKVDTLAAIVEALEGNNAVTRTLTVVEGPGPDEFAPDFTAGPTATPLVTAATFQWKTNEPSTGALHYGLTAAFGDSVTTARDTLHHAQVEGLAANRRYYFAVVARDTLGNARVSPLDSMTTLASSVGAESPPPSRLALSAARPNPTRGAAVMSLELPQAARVQLTVHDVQGRRVWSTPARELGAGRWRLEWAGRNDNGSRAGAGLYLAQVQVDGTTFVRRIALIR
jgi:glucose/arabinose dehydrogenase/chitodextrinase